MLAVRLESASETKGDLALPRDEDLVRLSVVLDDPHDITTP